MKTFSITETETIREAIEDALTEVEVCEDISQGVEDKLRVALEILDNGEEEK